MQSRVTNRDELFTFLCTTEKKQYKILIKWLVLAANSKFLFIPTKKISINLPSLAASQLMLLQPNQLECYLHTHAVGHGLKYVMATIYTLSQGGEPGTYNLLTQSASIGVLFRCFLTTYPFIMSGMFLELKSGL